MRGKITEKTKRIKKRIKENKNECSFILDLQKSRLGLGQNNRFINTVGETRKLQEVKSAGIKLLKTLHFVVFA